MMLCFRNIDKDNDFKIFLDLICFSAQEKNTVRILRELAGEHTETYSRLPP